MRKLRQRLSNDAQLRARFQSQSCVSLELMQSPALCSHPKSPGNNALHLGKYRAGSGGLAEAIGVGWSGSFLEEGEIEQLLAWGQAAWEVRAGGRLVAETWILSWHLHLAG